MIVFLILVAIAASICGEWLENVPLRTARGVEYYKWFAIYSASVMLMVLCTIAAGLKFLLAMEGVL